MKLAGQYGRMERGYAMAVLLVGLAVIGILLSMAMPVWRQMAQREREEELIFRGKQYARAIGLFQRKYANAFPPNIDLLIEQKFLRRKYADPMAKGKDRDFQVMYQTTQAQRPGPTSGQGQTPTSSPSSGIGGAAGGVGKPAGPRGGVVGVVSKSKDKSIRLFNGRDHYNDWQFVYTPATLAPGGVPGSQRPGQPGPGGATTPGGIGSRPATPIRPSPVGPRPVG